MWNSADGGKTWNLVGPMGGTDNGPDGLAADPVVAVGPHRQVVVAGLAVDIQPTGTLALHAGTRVSTDAGRSFAAFGTAEQVSVPPPCLAGAAACDFLDKPWVAVDTTRSAYRGSVYLAWIHRQLPSGLEDLRFAVSRDAGRSYGPPLVLQHTSTADVLPTGFNENPQLAVRPDGTIDAVWNGLREGVPYILHAVSTDGGRSFSGAERVVRLDPTASRRGIVPTLAVSPKGRLGLCWAQSVAADHYDPRVRCVVADRHGDWRGPRRRLPDNRDRQYLPAATFQGERLWLAAYVASATRTTVVAVAMGKHDEGFRPPMTLQGSIHGDVSAAPLTALGGHPIGALAIAAEPGRRFSSTWRCSSTSGRRPRPCLNEPRGGPAQADDATDFGAYFASSSEDRRSGRGA